MGSANTRHWESSTQKNNALALSKILRFKCTPGKLDIIHTKRNAELQELHISHIIIFTLFFPKNFVLKMIL